MNTLNRRAWSRSAVSLVAFLALLFVPAGTLHFWQGWLYAFVFAASTTAISIYLLKHDPKLV
ncbi:MAG: isoprenylcysteine carboxylmethyltransferase family protein, partial [Pseudolabrys sp.]